MLCIVESKWSRRTANLKYGSIGTFMQYNEMIIYVFLDAVQQPERI